MIRPARVGFDDAGNPWSEEYGDVYHSAAGAAGQASHVFLGGNRLPERWAGCAGPHGQFVVLETGFGLGINFLATWAAWRALPAAQRPATLHVVSVEHRPPTREALLGAWPTCVPWAWAPLAQRLAAAWPVRTPGLHRLEFAEDDGRVVLTLGLGDAQTLIERLDAGVDAIYLDGFAPRKNPDIWQPALLRAIARRARPGATIATYTAAAAVRRALTDAGFTIERVAGFGGKRHMLRGVFAPVWRHRRHPPPPPLAADARREAVVVGAGLAGSAAAWSLARRGWRVTVLDRQPGPARETSAHRAAAMHPKLSADDNLATRGARAGLLFAWQAWQTLALAGRFDWRAAADGADPRDTHAIPAGRACGAFWPVTDGDAQRAWQARLAQLDFDPAFVRWQDAPPGLRFDLAGWCAPPALCAAWLAEPGIDLRVGVTAARLARSDGRWQVRDAAGATLATGTVLVLANALDAPALLRASGLGADALDIEAVRGQTSEIEVAADGRDAGGARGTMLCGDGYGVEHAPGVWTVGATYDEHDPDPVLREASHAENLARWRRLRAAAGRAESAAPVVRGGFVAWRSVARDRLPMIGALPDEAAIAAEARRLRGAQPADLPRLPGLYAILALASRGLTWSALAGEMIACAAEGEPAPIETDLRDAVDPARRLLRALRRGALPGAAQLPEQDAGATD